MRTEDYLSYVDSFKYTLSGEFAFLGDICMTFVFHSDWGLGWECSRGI